jgi:hypothetical protein
MMKLMAVIVVLSFFMSASVETLLRIVRSQCQSYSSIAGWFEFL